MKTKIKLIFIAPMELPIPAEKGAVEEVIWQLSQRLKSVYEVNIFNPIVYSLWGKAIRSLKILLLNLCREVCIVHSHNLYASTIISLYNLKLKHILTLHYPPTAAKSKERRRLLESILRYLDSLGTIITTPSLYVRDKLREMGVSKAVFIPNGVDIITFNPSRRSEELRETLLEGRETLIVSVGRIHPDKNQLALLMALKRLVHDYDIKSVRLLLIGPTTGVFRGRIRKNYYELLVGYVNKYDLKQYVKFMELERRRDVARVLASSDIYVHPSKVEAAPLAILEAMASKLPVVAFDLPYYKGYLVNGVNSILLPLNNVSLLTETLYTLLNDRSLAMKLSQNAYETAINYFSWDVLSKKYLDFYATLISQYSGLQ
jgi:glycosyltransferase involved in cell wall biosynthesis